MQRISPDPSSDKVQRRIATRWLTGEDVSSIARDEHMLPDTVVVILMCVGNRMFAHAQSLGWPISDDATWAAFYEEPSGNA